MFQNKKGPIFQEWANFYMMNPQRSLSTIAVLSFLEPSFRMAQSKATI
jgi:hypothetical protein